MATAYVRRFNLKDSLSDAEVLDYWRFLLDVVPIVESLNGVHSVKLYSGQGALRADLRIVIEMDNAAVYEQLLVDSEVRKLLGRLYGGMDLASSTQTFIREVTPELIDALSSTSAAEASPQQDGGAQGPMDTMVRGMGIDPGQLRGEPFGGEPGPRREEPR